MKKKEEIKIPWALIAVIGLTILASNFFAFIIIDEHLNTETKVIEGEIIEVKYLEESFGYDRLEIIFDNGDSYKILVTDDCDFTINSKFIIRMSKHKDSEFWSIHRIFKVPDG